MSLANNDYNWRAVAAVALDENTAVQINSSGKAAKATDASTVNGLIVQAHASGERAAVLRGGKLGGLVGFSAGDKLRVQSDATLGTAGTGRHVATVASEDATTAYIMSGNLDG